jgi:hypothetical protein
VMWMKDWVSKVCYDGGSRRQQGRGRQRVEENEKVGASDRRKKGRGTPGWVALCWLLHGRDKVGERE